MTAMRALPGHLLAASFLLALVGCGGNKQDPAEALCDLHFSCDCTQTNYPDVATCVTDVRGKLDQQDEAARTFAADNGLDFDQGCVDKVREVPEDLGCELEVAESNKCLACAVVHGDQPLGAGCTVKGFFSDCARDLVCNAGLCVDPCQRLSAGDSCGQGSSIATCGEGLFCDSGNTKKCQPTGGVGSPCPTGDGCNEDTYCKDMKTCEAPPRAGEPCGPLGLCAEQLYCAGATTCEAIPGDGQPCPDFLCQQYLVCEAGACKPGPGVGEPCPSNGSCGPDTECQGETCVVEQAAVCSLEVETPDDE